MTAVQLLWVNLIVSRSPFLPRRVSSADEMFSLFQMDTFAALALATDPATPASLKRKPDAKTAPLITIDMFKVRLPSDRPPFVATLPDLFVFSSSRR